jgi:hypothetical protein
VPLAGERADAGCDRRGMQHIAAVGRVTAAQVSEIALSGGPIRFDYTALDDERGRLFIAHMGTGELIELDVRAYAVVRTVPKLPDIHGVIVVPDKHRVYATATGDNQLAAIDEDSGRVVFRAPTDTYPDALAYDIVRRMVWTTNESAGTETVIDADTGAVRATVPLGGEVGNVVYNPSTDRMVVAVQGRNDLAVIDPVSFTVTERIPTPGCEHPHGEALDVIDQVMFVGCEANATMVTVDLANRHVHRASRSRRHARRAGLRFRHQPGLRRWGKRSGQHFRSGPRPPDGSWFCFPRGRGALTGSRPHHAPHLHSDPQGPQRLTSSARVRTHLGSELPSPAALDRG